MFRYLYLKNTLQCFQTQHLILLNPVPVSLKHDCINLQLVRQGRPDFMHVLSLVCVPKYIFPNFRKLLLVFIPHL